MMPSLMLLIIVTFCLANHLQCQLASNGIQNCENTEYQLGTLLRCNALAGDMKSVYFHGIFDFQRPSALSLFTLQICRALTLCFQKENFRVVLHVPETSNNHYELAASFLRELSISYSIWKGTFDTVALQRVRLESLKFVNSSDKVIFQVDADEFPYFPTSDLSSVLSTLTSSEPEACDAIYGFLSERLPANGDLVNITLRPSLSTQLPLICDLKQSLEGAAHRKIIFYRALFRPSVGNHRLICEEKSSLSACHAMLSKSSKLMQDNHPAVHKLPRRCKSQVKIHIDHYKYTWGIERYLETRVRNFKRAGLPWHSESTAVLESLKLTGGKHQLSFNQTTLIKRLIQTRNRIPMVSPIYFICYNSMSW